MHPVRDEAVRPRLWLLGVSRSGGACCDDDVVEAPLPPADGADAGDGPAFDDICEWDPSADGELNEWLEAFAPRDALEDPTVDRPVLRRALTYALQVYGDRVQVRSHLISADAERFVQTACAESKL